MGTNGNSHKDHFSSKNIEVLLDDKPRKAALSVFARNFLKHPAMVGWVLPSSRFLVNQLLKQIQWDNARVIVEYGPGMGSFTTRLLERMRPDAKLIALEINPEFCAYLSRTVTDPRFHLVNESATEIDSVLARFGHSHADYIISGIPFRMIPHPLREAIVQKTHAVLRPNGRFLVYQFSSAVLPHLERVFGRVSREFEFMNILPARLFYCAR